jgi:hypothetical protein
LEKAGMVDLASFKTKSGQDAWIPILEVADFNSLIAISQEHQVPVYAVTQQQAEQQGAVWKQTQESMITYSNAFSAFADLVIALAA